MARTVEQIQADITSARAALLQLSMGGQTRVIQDQNGERQEFTAGNVNALRSLIRELEWELGCAGGPAVPLGPMRTLA